MSQEQPAISGYTHNGAILAISETEIAVVKNEPLLARLEIVTHDGRLCLSLTTDAAADLMIDLKQFLANDL